MAIWYEPWCCKYNGGCCFLSSKYRSTQSNKSGWRPSDVVGRWKSINSQFIRNDESNVTTSVAPIHFRVLYNLQPSCSDPCNESTSNLFKYIWILYFKKSCINKCAFYKIRTCTSNPCAHAASTNFCNLDMLGIALRDGVCEPHAAQIAV